MESDLYVMDADGKDVARLTATRGVTEGDPEWSPTDITM